MLKARIITSIIFLLILLCAILYLPQALLMAMVWLICLMAIYEFTKMYNFKINHQIALMVASTLLALSVYLSHFEYNHLILGLMTITWCLLSPFMLIIKPKLLTKLFVWIIALLIFVPSFYAINNIYTLLGVWNMLAIMAVGWISDIGAYFIGGRFGCHKLAYDISPGKSIEGAFGGLIAVYVYLIILKISIHPSYLYTYLMLFKFGLMLTSAGIVGDLLESLFKRIAQVKDSGTILPGHGGMFDRIDSLVAIMPVACLIIWNVL